VHLTSSEAEESQEVLEWLGGWADLSAHEPDERVSPTLADDLRYRRAVEMHALGLREQARDAFNALRSDLHDPLLLYQLALVTRDLELYAPSLRAAIDLTVLAPEESAAEMPRQIQRLAYPTYYPDRVLAESASLGLDPLLLFALIRQESLYDDQVASWAGAIGLAQIMPATGQWIAEMIGWPGYEVGLLQRPYLNLKFGAWFLDRLLDQAEGDVFTALAGYNGGPGLALQWQARAAEHGTGRTDPDLLLEIIPKPETQRYLRAVYRHYDMYHRLYADGPWQPAN
jgi:soluble lytic murein transglycosylase